MEDVVECFCREDSVSLSVPEQLADGLEQKSVPLQEAEKERSDRRWWIAVFTPIVGAILRLNCGRIGCGMEVGVMGDEGTGSDTGEDRGTSGTGTMGDALIDSSASAIGSRIRKQTHGVSIQLVSSNLQGWVAPAVVHRAMMVEFRVATAMAQRSSPTLVQFESRDELLARWVSR